jgi:hypothetical protein
VETYYRISSCFCCQVAVVLNKKTNTRIALDVQISLSPTVSVRVTAAAAATIAAPVTLRSEKNVRMCVNTLRRTKSWKRMLTQSGTQQRCARPRGVCRPKQPCNKPSTTWRHPSSRAALSSGGDGWKPSSGGVCSGVLQILTHSPCRALAVLAHTIAASSSRARWML